MEIPIVFIGGLGGSGTRIYAELLSHIGYDLGENINEQNDNLLFTTLMKDPDWFETAKENDKIFRLEIFKKLISGSKLTRKEASTWEECKVKNDFYSKHLKVSTQMIGKKLVIKEPNSHLFLNEIKTCFSNSKYILVMRHGLDMAFSKNLQQLHNWGNLIFNIDIKEGSSYYSQLKYWIEMNSRAISIGKDSFKSDFLISHFDKLFIDQKFELNKLVNFLNEKVSKTTQNNLKKSILKPSSLGRYINEDLSQFDPIDVAKVFELNKSK